MARTDTLGHFLTDVADAIREKKGTEETILASDFDTEIENLPSGGSKYAPKFISFYNYTGLDLQDLIDDNNISYSNIISTNQMFSLTGATSSTTNLTTIDISKISNEANGITDVNGMFYMRENLQSIQGLDTLDTSNVTDMSGMFYECRSITNLDLSNFDTSNVTTMQSMFNHCGLLIPSGSYLNLNIKDFNVSKVNNFFYMFNGCKLQTLDLSGWELSNSLSINMSSMFIYCNYLTHIDMRKMNFANVTNYNNMFGYASSGVPDDCEIIVADDTQKTWITSKFSRLTNVKTVAEYEAS